MKCNKIYILLGILTLCFANNTFAQFNQLQDIRICLDPGHGGHDSDDRPTELGIGTTYYESDANWEAIGYLDTLLQKFGAVVKNTKTTNDPDSPDRQPSLSDRVQVANAFNSDYFHSFHTNGSSNQTVNYTLMLYAGPADGNAENPDALVMADIMDDELFKYMKTSQTSARADIPFTGFTNGLGVLNNLNMPATLSECSFHSNVNEGRRLMNSSYRKAAAWGILKSFFIYFEQELYPVGELGGVVSDIQGTVLNEIVVTLNPDTPEEKIYTGDMFLNGFYFFDWLQPGEYELKIEKEEYDTQTTTVTIVPGAYTELDIKLTGGPPVVPAVPSLEYVLNVGGGSGIKARWIANTEPTLLGYRLYYATNDDQTDWALAADENTLDAQSTSLELASSDDFVVVPAGDVYHFKLTAVEATNLESGAGDIFSRSSNSTGNKMLIVNGFDRRNGSYTETYHDFTTNYLISVRDSKEAEVGTATNETITNGTIVLTDYDVVVWFVGDESTEDESLSIFEQAELASFLEAGGKLFISGAEIAWDLDNRGGARDRDFIHDYLKAEYVGDGASNYSPATGIAESDFENIVIEFGIAYPEDFPDDIAPINGSDSILTYNIEGTHAGVAYKGVFGTGTEDGAVVYIAFPLESASQEDQTKMMGKVIDYFDKEIEIPLPPLGSELKQDEVAGITLYPNPASENAQLQVSLKNEFKGEWQLSIYSLEGKLVKESTHRITENRQDLTLDLSSLESGLYTLTLSSKNNISTLKFVKN